MLTFRKFLENAPRKFVARYYQAIHPDKPGVIANSEAIAAICAHFLDPRRVQNDLQKMTPDEAQLLGRIYLRGSLGATESLLLNASRWEISQLSNTLQSLASSLWICPTAGDSKTYLGFREHLPGVCAQLRGPSSDLPTGGQEYGYSRILFLHLLDVLAAATCFRFRILKEEQLHRRDVASLKKLLRLGEQISESVPAFELDFILRLASGKWLENRDGVLQLSPKGRKWLELPPHQMETSVFHRWLELRCGGSREWLETLLSQNRYLNIASAAFLFSAWDSPPVQGYNAGANLLTWDQLPETLREFWLLGGGDFHLEKGRIAGIRFHPEILHGEKTGESRNRETRENGEKPKCLPNLEFYLQPSHSPRIRFLAGVYAEKKNDDVMARFHFSKQRMIQGLHASQDLQNLEFLLRGLEMDPATEKSLRQWLSRFEACEFVEGILLKVTDASQHALLRELPEFQSSVLDTVPNYGFVIKEQDKEQVREILHHLDLYPGPPEESQKAKPWLYGQGFTPSPVSGYAALDYTLATRSSRNSDFFNHSKYGSQARFLSLTDKLRIIEQAILTGKLLEVSEMENTPKRTVLRPIHLNQEEAEATLIGVNLHSGHRSTFPVNAFSSMRTLDT